MRIHPPSLDSYTSFRNAVEVAARARTIGIKYRVSRDYRDRNIWRTWASPDVVRYRIDRVEVAA